MKGREEGIGLKAERSDVRWRSKVSGVEKQGVRRGWRSRVLGEVEWVEGGRGVSSVSFLGHATPSESTTRSTCWLSHETCMTL